MFIIVLIRFHSLGGDLPPSLKIIYAVPSEGAFITFATVALCLRSAPVNWAHNKINTFSSRHSSGLHARLDLCTDSEVPAPLNQPHRTASPEPQNPDPWIPHQGEPQ